MSDYKELAFPFDASYDQSGVTLDENGVPDRVYSAADFTRERMSMYSNGIWAEPANNLQVVSIRGSMVITVRQGKAFIQGKYYELYDGDMDLTVSPMTAAYPRKDIVVLRLDEVKREMKIYIKRGMYNSNPKEPLVTRTKDVYELKLAVINLSARQNYVPQSDITDTRFDPDVCGITDGRIQRIDTKDIFLQYQDYLNQNIEYWNNRKTEFENDFNDKLKGFEDDYNQKFSALENSLNNLYNGLETASYVLVNHNFDDISVKRGCVYKTEFMGESIVETITLKSTDDLIAKRTTMFPSPKTSEIETIFNKWETSESGNRVITKDYRIKEVTSLEQDGIISKEVF